MSYGPLSVVYDLFSSIYSFFTSLCCAVNCTTEGAKVNDRNCKVVKLLAEGGFSFVYLVEDDKKKKYALKKVLSQLPEQSELARWEIKVHKAFKHPNLLQLVDDCMVPTSNGAEEFRLLMPLFEGGTLLDRCTMHLKAGTRLGEKEILRMFEGVLQGILQFHTHSPPWAHRDIKPANVLLGPGDEPVLMDFGSTALARKKITNRQEALLLQEDAAQNCSMPYRAPELFDVPSDATIDERTDIFSLGATLYAMGFYYSPFECTYQDATQRVVECSYLRVIGGAQFPPDKAGYSDSLIEMINWMLTVDPRKRPFVADVHARCVQLVAGATA
jgi:serine/threonine kinase 16